MDLTNASQDSFKLLPQNIPSTSTNVPQAVAYGPGVPLLLPSQAVPGPSPSPSQAVLGAPLFPNQLVQEPSLFANQSVPGPPLVSSQADSGPSLVPSQAVPGMFLFPSQSVPEPSPSPNQSVSGPSPFLSQSVPGPPLVPSQAVSGASLFQSQSVLGPFLFPSQAAQGALLFPSQPIPGPSMFPSQAIPGTSLFPSQGPSSALASFFPLLNPNFFTQAFDSAQTRYTAPLLVPAEYQFLNRSNSALTHLTANANFGPFRKKKKQSMRGLCDPKMDISGINTDVMNKYTFEEKCQLVYDYMTTQYLLQTRVSDLAGVTNKDVQAVKKFSTIQVSPGEKPMSDESIHRLCQWYIGSTTTPENFPDFMEQTIGQKNVRIWSYKDTGKRGNSKKPNPKPPCLLFTRQLMGLEPMPAAPDNLLPPARTSPMDEEVLKKIGRMQISDPNSSQQPLAVNQVVAAPEIALEAVGPANPPQENQQADPIGEPLPLPAPLLFQALILAVQARQAQQAQQAQLVAALNPGVQPAAAQFQLPFTQFPYGIPGMLGGDQLQNVGPINMLNVQQADNGPRLPEVAFAGVQPSN